jgi:hypothetical protein
MSVLLEDEIRGYRNFSKEPFLRSLVGWGLHLIDVAKCPINKLLRGEKMEVTKCLAVVEYLHH